MGDLLIEKKNVLDKETRNKVKFITFMIHYFARSYKMNKLDAYLYLKKCGGLDFCLNTGGRCIPAILWRRRVACTRFAIITAV